MKIDEDTEVWAMNHETDEAERIGFFVYYEDKPKIRNQDFFFMFQKSLELIAKNDELNGADMRVLMLLLARLDFENYIRVTQKDIAAATKIRQQHVSSALIKLIKLNIIEKVAEGNLRAYRLHPNYAWKGSIQSLKEEKRDRKNRKVIPFNSVQK
jgi:DNA-binding transcriptional regulator GbsR (MarR family)